MEAGLKIMAVEDNEEMKNGGRFNFEETELRLGLPGAGGRGSSASEVEAATATAAKACTNANGKRGFEEEDGHVDLKLILSSPKEPKVDLPAPSAPNNNDKPFISSSNDPPKPPSKGLVVGWPPVQSFRKNILAVHKNNSREERSDDHEKVISNGNNNNNNKNNGGGLVKVSMDGAPYLRKVDLRMYNSYHQLSDALSNMFSSFTIGRTEFMNESKLMDLLSSSDYVPTYEDSDNDWMLVGDVPWEMFVGSCKRLRIMKGAEPKGLEFTGESGLFLILCGHPNRGNKQNPRTELPRIPWMCV